MEIIAQFVLKIIAASGYFGIFVLMALESANIPVPSEIIMPFSGFLISSASAFGGLPAGGFNFWLVVLAGAFGNLAGSLFSYWLGSLASRNVLKWNNHKINQEAERGREWLDKWGDVAVFASRLLPVARTFISFPAGIMKIDLARFSLLTFLGSFFWCLILTETGVILGSNWNVLAVYFHRFDYLIVAMVFGTAVYWLYWRYKNAEARATAND